jgi:hypothetical protein
MTLPVNANRVALAAAPSPRAVLVPFGPESTVGPPLRTDRPHICPPIYGNVSSGFFQHFAKIPLWLQLRRILGVETVCFFHFECLNANSSPVIHRNSYSGFTRDYNLL